MKDDIARQALDPCAGSQPLMTVEAAIERALSLSTAVSEVETVPLDDAIGRVLAQDVTAPFPLPPFDNSAMDGYALRSADLVGDGPWRLKVVARVAAGEDAAQVAPLTAGQAVRIFTGAPIPSGADAVVMQEKVHRDGDSLVLTSPVACGDCIRRAGEDSEQGAVLLPAGTLIGAREIGAIASVGLPQIAVRRRINVALICTGSELRQPGEALGPGQIYNSNRFMMVAALRQPWIRMTDLGAVEDDPNRLRETLVQASRKADLIVTTGGVSVGEEDHMTAQLRLAGGQVEVMKIAMKPGKPLTVGRLGKSVLLGLPGNPVAAFTTWKIIGQRIAARLSGQRDTARPGVQAEVTETFTRRPGRQEYRPARVVGDAGDGCPRIELLDRSFSAKISLICQSDGLAVIPAAAEQVSVGARLEFIPL